MPNFKYYIFNSLNIRDDSIRWQLSRKRVPINKVFINKLIFQDHTVWLIEIGKDLFIMLKANELEEVLLARGAKMEVYTSQHPYSVHSSEWQFDKKFLFRMDFGTYQGGSYWDLQIGRGRTYTLYGYGDDEPTHSFLEEKRHNCYKSYEGNELPKAEDYPDGVVPTKPMNSNWGCVIGFLLVIIAAIIYSMVA